MTELEKAAGRVVRAWTGHDTNVSVPAMIKAEMKASWPEMYEAVEHLKRHVQGAWLKGENL